MRKKTRESIAMPVQPQNQLTPAQAETMSLNQQLAELQTKKSAGFEKLGRMYYEMQSSEPDESLIGPIEEIRACEIAEKKIDIRIKFLRGIVTCVECETENEVAASFCCKCGAQLPHMMQNRQDVNHCSRCGCILAPGHLFCGVCGARVEEPIPEAEPSVPEEPRVCATCGAAIMEADAVFCAECGTKIQ